MSEGSDGDADDDSAHWDRPRNEEGDFIAEDDDMTEKDDEIDEEIRQAEVEKEAKTTKSAERRWVYTNDLIAGGTILASFITLWLAGSGHLDPELLTETFRNALLFMIVGTLMWAYGIDFFEKYNELKDSEGE